MKRVVSYDVSGKRSVFASGFDGAGIVVAHNGNVYVSDPSATSDAASRIWLIKPGGEKTAVQTAIRTAKGLALSTDQTLLYVADARSHWIYSYQIQKDGSLQDEQRYYWLHSPDLSDDSGAGGMTVDTEGRLYIATSLGIQVCDQAGRVNVILPTPNGKVSSVSFGGVDGSVLYAASGDKVFRRKVKSRGAYAWSEPVKPAAPRL